MIFIFIAMFIFFFCGMPIAFGILSSTIYYLLISDQSRELLSFSARMISASDSYVLLAVPFFMLAAELMNESKITDRIFGFARSLVGHIPGGLGHVNVVASMIFAGMSGSGLADTSGLGKVEIKAMKDDGYDPAFSAAVTASSAIIGPIIPPSICMVVGAVVTNTSVGRMLVGGVIPGFLMGTGLMLVVYFLSKKRGYPRMQRETLKGIWAKFLGTGPALLTPVILVGGIIWYFHPDRGGRHCLYICHDPCVGFLPGIRFQKTVQDLYQCGYGYRRAVVCHVRRRSSGYSGRPRSGAPEPYGAGYVDYRKSDADHVYHCGRPYPFGNDHGGPVTSGDHGTAFAAGGAQIGNKPGSFWGGNGIDPSAGHDYTSGGYGVLYYLPYSRRGCANLQQGNHLVCDDTYRRSYTDVPDSACGDIST